MPTTKESADLEADCKKGLMCVDKLPPVAGSYYSVYGRDGEILQTL